MGTAIERWWREERGQDLVEFTLLAAFVAFGSSLLLTPDLWRSVSSPWCKPSVKIG